MSLAAVVVLVGGSAGAAQLCGDGKPCTFQVPYRATTGGRSTLARCTDDQIYTEQDAKARAEWCYKCNHLNERVWEYWFTTGEDYDTMQRVPLPQGKRNYPIFVRTLPNVQPEEWPIWHVEAETAVNGVPYQKCDMPSDVVFYDYCLNGCYESRQRILFSDGYAPIGEIVAQNVTKTLMVLAPTSTMESPVLVDKQIAYYVASPSKSEEKLVEFRMQSGGRLVVTPTHPLLSEAGYIRYADLFDVGDSLVQMNGQLDSIVEKRSFKEFTKVYNLAPKTSNPIENILVAQGYLNGSHLYQDGLLEGYSQVVLRTSIPADLAY